MATTNQLPPVQPASGPFGLPALDAAALVRDLAGRASAPPAVTPTGQTAAAADDAGLLKLMLAGGAVLAALVLLAKIK